MDEQRKQEERADAGQAAEDPEALEDMDVPQAESEDVKGGNQPVRTYSFKQGWPKKYE